MENIRSLNCLAENMRRLRKIKHLTQEELAYRSGLHPYSIGLIERKVKAPSLRSVEKIAHALNVSVVELVEELRNTKKMIQNAREREIAQILSQITEKQADVLLGALKTIVETFCGVGQVSKLKVTKSRAGYTKRKTKPH